MSKNPRNILVRIRIHRSLHLIKDPALDPALFDSEFKMPTKVLFLIFFWFLLSVGTLYFFLHLSSKIKVIKKTLNSTNEEGFPNFVASWWIDGSGYRFGAVQNNYGSGSRRPKKYASYGCGSGTPAKNIANAQKILLSGVSCLWPVSVLDLYVFLEQGRLWGRVAALTTGEAAVQVSRQLHIRKKIDRFGILQNFCTPFRVI